MKFQPFIHFYKNDVDVSAIHLFYVFYCSCKNNVDFS